MFVPQKLTYRQVVDSYEYDRKRDPRFTNMSLEEYSAAKNEETQSEMFEVGKSGTNWLKDASVALDRQFEARGTNQAAGDIGAVIGDVFGRGDLGRQMGAAQPRALTNMLPMLIPGTGVIGAAASGLGVGADVYEKTGRPGEALVAAGLTTAFPKIFSAAEQATLKGLEKAGVSGIRAVGEAGRLAGAGAATQGTAYAAGQAGALGAGVATDIGTQLAYDGEVNLGEDYWTQQIAGQIPFLAFDVPGVVSGAKGARQILRGEDAVRQQSVANTQQALVNSRLFATDPTFAPKDRYQEFKQPTAPVSSPNLAGNDFRMMQPEVKAPDLVPGMDVEYNGRTWKFESSQGKPQGGAPNVPHVTLRLPETGALVHVPRADVKVASPAATVMGQPAPKATPPQEQTVVAHGLPPVLNTDVGQVYVPYELKPFDVFRKVGRDVKDAPLALGEGFESGLATRLQFDDKGQITRLGKVSVPKSGLVHVSRLKDYVPSEEIATLKVEHPELVRANGMVNLYEYVKAVKGKAVLETKVLSDVDQKSGENRLGEITHQLDTILGNNWTTNLTRGELMNNPDPVVRDLYAEYQSFVEGRGEQAGTFNKTRFKWLSAYSSDKMESYAELLLKAPQKGGLNDTQKARLNYLQDIINQGRELGDANQREWETLYDKAKDGQDWFDEDHFTGETNILGFSRGFLEHTADGRKVWHIQEAQSDWATKRRKAIKLLEKAIAAPSAGERNPEYLAQQKAKLQELLSRPDDHPLLPHYQRLVLMQALEHAAKQGATHVVLHDGPTAMMTEGHDKMAHPAGWVVTENGQPANIGLTRTFPTEELARVEAEALRSEFPGRNWGHSYHKGEPSQEKGMRAAYDVAYRNILRELTGVEPSFGVFGEHGQAEKSTGPLVYQEPIVQGDFDAKGQQQLRLERQFPGHRVIYDEQNFKVHELVPGSPYLKNRDGTPKSNVTGYVYNIAPFRAARQKRTGQPLRGSIAEHVKRLKLAWDRSSFTDISAEYGTQLDSHDVFAGKTHPLVSEERLTPDIVATEVVPVLADPDLSSAVARVKGLYETVLKPRFGVTDPHLDSLNDETLATNIKTHIAAGDSIEDAIEREVRAAKAALESAVEGKQSEQAALPGDAQRARIAELRAQREARRRERGGNLNLTLDPLSIVSSGRYSLEDVPSLVEELWEYVKLAAVMTKQGVKDITFQTWKKVVADEAGDQLDLTANDYVELWYHMRERQGDREAKDTWEAYTSSLQISKLPEKAQLAIWSEIQAVSNDPKYNAIPNLFTHLVKSAAKFQGIDPTTGALPAAGAGQKNLRGWLLGAADHARKEELRAKGGRELGKSDWMSNEEAGRLYNQWRDEYPQDYIHVSQSTRPGELHLSRVVRYSNPAESLEGRAEGRGGADRDLETAARDIEAEPDESQVPESGAFRNEKLPPPYRITDEGEIEYMVPDADGDNVATKSVRDVQARRVSAAMRVALRNMTPERVKSTGVNKEHSKVERLNVVTEYIMRKDGILQPSDTQRGWHAAVLPLIQARAAELRAEAKALREDADLIIQPNRKAAQIERAEKLARVAEDTDLQTTEQLRSWYSDFAAPFLFGKNMTVKETDPTTGRVVNTKFHEPGYFEREWQRLADSGKPSYQKLVRSVRKRVYGKADFNTGLKDVRYPMPELPYTGDAASAVTGALFAADWLKQRGYGGLDIQESALAIDRFARVAATMRGAERSNITGLTGEHPSGAKPAGMKLSEDTPGSPILVAIRKSMLGSNLDGEQFHLLNTLSHELAEATLAAAQRGDLLPGQLRSMEKWIEDAGNMSLDQRRALLIRTTKTLMPKEWAKMDQADRAYMDSGFEYAAADPKEFVVQLMGTHLQAMADGQSGRLTHIGREMQYNDDGLARYMRVLWSRMRDYATFAADLLGANMPARKFLTQFAKDLAPLIRTPKEVEDAVGRAQAMLHLAQWPDLVPMVPDFDLGNYVKSDFGKTVEAAYMRMLPPGHEQHTPKGARTLMPVAQLHSLYPHVGFNRVTHVLEYGNAMGAQAAEDAASLFEIRKGPGGVMQGTEAHRALKMAEKNTKVVKAFDEVKKMENFHDRWLTQDEYAEIVRSNNLRPAEAAAMHELVRAMGGVTSRMADLTLQKHTHDMVDLVAATLMGDGQTTMEAALPPSEMLVDLAMRMAGIKPMQGGQDINVIAATQNVDPAKLQAVLVDEEFQAALKRHAGLIEQISNKPWRMTETRYGKFQMTYLKDGDKRPVYRDFDTKAQMMAEYAKLSADPTVSSPRMFDSDSDFAGPMSDIAGSVIATEQAAFNRAVQRMSPEAQKEVGEFVSIGKSTLAEMTKRSADKYLKQRKMGPGREFLNMLDQGFNYMASYPRAIAATRTQSRMRLLMSDATVAANPELVQFAQAKLKDFSSTTPKPVGQIRNAAFYAYIGVGHLLMEPLQPYMNVPYDAVGAFGTTTWGAHKALASAYTLFAKTAMKSKFLDGDGSYGDAVTDQIMTKLADDKVLDRGVSSLILDDDHDRFRAAQLGQGKWKDAVDSVTRPLGQIGRWWKNTYSMASSITPKVSALTAIELLKPKIASGALSLEDAVTQVRDFVRLSSPGSGGKITRPAMFGGDQTSRSALSVLTTLTGYTQAMYATHYRLARQAHKAGWTSSQAMAYLGLTATQLALAGAVGMPVIGQVVGMLEQAGVPVQALAREGIAGLTGDDDDLGMAVSDTALRGLASRATGLDLSSRFSLGSLFGTSSYHGFRVQDIAGPVGGLVNRGGDTIEQIKDGKVREAAANWLPANLSKLVKLWSNDWEARDSAGNLLADANPYENFLNVVGFTPKHVADKKDAIRIEKQLNDRDQRTNSKLLSEVADLVGKQRWKEAREILNTAAKENPRFDAVGALREAIGLHQRRTRPIDPRDVAGSARTALDREQVLSTFQRTPSHSETDRLQERDAIYTQMGVRPRTSRRDYGKAQLMDSMLEVNPFAPRDEIARQVQDLMSPDRPGER